MPKSARVKRIDGDQSDLPYVVQTPNNELVRISVRQARDLYNAESAGYAAALEHVKQTAIRTGNTSEGIYLKSLPFPKSPQIADGIFRFVGKYLSSRRATAVGAIIGVIGLVVFAFDSDLHTLRSATDDNAVALLLTMVVWDFVLTLLHELGHALALIRFGQPIKAMGICFYFGSPAFYTDSTLALLLNKRQRIIQSGAGAWVDFVIAGIIAIVVAIFMPDGLIGAVITNAMIFTYFAGWINLAPIMKLDGYWMLSDALGRPQLMKEGFAALRANWRSKLGAYGLVSVIATGVLILSSIYFWKNSFHRVLTPAWHQSLIGKALVVFFVGIAGVALVGPLFSAVGERRRRRVEDLEFEGEHDDRVRAAETWDELPWEPEFTGDELGIIAGTFEMFIPAPDQPLTTAGEIPAGVFVVLAPQPYVLGLESLTGTPSTATTTLDEGTICAFLTTPQARIAIGSHQLSH